MSETKKNDEIAASPAEAPRFQAEERALERLALGWDPQSSPVLDGDDAEVREQLATLALLAYDAEPVTPSATTREALLERIRSTSGATSAPLPFRPAEPSAPSGSSVPSIGLPAHPGASETGWMTWALAAGLVFCLVGLGYAFGQLNAKDAVIALQQQRLETMPELESDLRQVRDDLRRSQDQLVMVNTVARIAYPMRFVANEGAASASGPGEPGMPPKPGMDPRPGMAPNGTPKGRVFVCGAHQQWYLTLSGLDSPPTDREYHFWFLTEDGAVDAGTLRPEDGYAEMRDLQMPTGTHGFTVTLEPREGSQGSGSQSSGSGVRLAASDGGPQGRAILVGDQPVSL